MTSYTQSWYTEPRSRTGSRERLTQDDIDNLGDDAVIYSQRGEAPEGFYNAGMTEGGAGYGDHQVFKKLPKAQAALSNDEPVEEKENDNDKETESRIKIPLPSPSQEVTDAKARSAAYKEEVLNGDNFGSYGGKKRFAERSTTRFNPNEGFQFQDQSSVSAIGDQLAQAYMQDKLNKAKSEFKFKPTLS